MTLIDRFTRKTGLRVRIFLFFLLALVASLGVLFAASWYFAGNLEGDASIAVMRIGIVAGFAITGILVAIWLQFDTHVARPIERLSRFAHTAAHAGNLGQKALPDARYLGFLAPAVSALTESLNETRARQDAVVAEATARAERQKARLESVLYDLRDGILICNRDHEVLLYNPRAHDILSEIGPVGLRRPVFDVLSPEPLRHALMRLEKRHRESRHINHQDGLSFPFAALCADGRTTLEAMMTLTLVPGSDEPQGYILSFSDETETLAENAEAERQIIGISEALREQASSISLLSEFLNLTPGLDGRARALTADLMTEASTLATTADRLDRLAQDHLASGWPMAPVLATTLFDLVNERIRLPDAVDIDAEAGLTILCDSPAIAALLARLCEWLSARGATAILLTAAIEEEQGFVDLVFEGDTPRIAEVDRWLAGALDHDLGPVTALDVLARHSTGLWPEPVRTDRARLRLPLEMRDAKRIRALPLHLPERRATYDFDLFDQKLPHDLADVRLDQLTAVVFDTETTGLEPSRGDQMVSIAGVRIVNGRVLEGEVFNELINPGRPIPPASTRIHGITDAMVDGAGSPAAITRLFHGFARDAVLIAHNAPFDMRFLANAGEPAGIHFTNPVLDTVLLAAHLHGAEDSLTLDRLAEVYDVSLPEEVRHTAHGDALATAGVFVRMIAPLTAAGVCTLGDATRVSEAQAAIRRRQAKY